MKEHEIKWLTNIDTLKQQTVLSLKDRSTEFQRQFPAAHMNPTLLRLVYRKHGINLKKIRWYKTPKEQDPAAVQQKLTTMKR